MKSIIGTFFSVINFVLFDLAKLILRNISQFLFPMLDYMLCSRREMTLNFFLSLFSNQQKQRS